MNTIEEAVELLTGVRARPWLGVRSRQSLGRAAQRLAELAQAIVEWSEGETKPDGRIITEV